jgi:hypothetical protein
VLAYVPYTGADILGLGLCLRFFFLISAVEQSARLEMGDLLYMCPHTIYVSSCKTIYVLILLYMCQVWRMAVWGGAGARDWRLAILTYADVC